jgi:hypothetical protein
VYNTYIKMAKTLSLPNIWAAFQGIRVEWSLAGELFHILLCYLSPGKVEGI